ncbi:MAG TPA: hypothetical protein VMU51_11895 [Mycobacteriales bacterium]|nr:hypothetical protein [Mycobacteriales bacterium]
MAEPLSIAAIGAVALTEGVKFLYGQAGELLARWRARRSAPDPAAEVAAAPVVLALPPAAFTGSLAPVAVDYDLVERLAGQLKDLAADLAPYAGGFDEIDPTDQALLGRVDALRLALEAVLGQRLTFVGEQRPASGTPVVSGAAVVGEIEGRVAAVRARQIRAGRVTGAVRADHVAPGGEAYGVDADVIGPG